MLPHLYWQIMLHISKQRNLKATSIFAKQPRFNQVEEKYIQSQLATAVALMAKTEFTLNNYKHYRHSEVAKWKLLSEYLVGNNFNFTHQVIL